MSLYCKSYILSLLVSFMVSPSFAEEPLNPSSQPSQATVESGPGELVTDRPDQTESSRVVPIGYTQVEMGWSHSENDDSGTKTRINSLPEILVRVGLMKGLELRLGFDGIQSAQVNTNSPYTKVDNNGSGDSSIGMKYYLCTESGYRPEMALLASISLPTGESGFSSRRMDPSWRLCCSHTLPRGLSFSYNLGMAFDSAEDSGGDRHTLSVMEWTATVGRGITDKMGAYFELYGEAGLSAQGGPSNSVDAGLTYLLQENFQADAFVGLGLSEDADDWTVGLGFSYRFPN